MYLKSILINNFKNIKSSELQFSPKINCITGSNGVGKTNLLDAVYFLSMTKSFFHFPDSASIMHNQQAAVIVGNYQMDDGIQNRISLSFSKNSINQEEGTSATNRNKVLKKNEKSYKRFSDHIGEYPIVMVSPADISLVASSADERRRFFNQLISQVDKEYLYQIQKYNKLIAQRNKLLKDGANLQKDLIDILNEQLSDSAQYIHNARKNMTDMLNDSVAQYYSKISGERERVNIKYQSDLFKEKLSVLLDKYFERDKMLTYTSVGVHKDEFVFEMTDAEANMHPIKICASQGQQKCFLISLKLAQFSIMQRLNNNIAPILLLDDIFDKLDMSRVEYLLSMVCGDQFGQIFITDSNKVRMNSLIEKIGSEYKDFTVDGGEIR